MARYSDDHLPVFPLPSSVLRTRFCNLGYNQTPMWLPHARDDQLAQEYDRRWAGYLDVSMRAVLDALDPQNGTRILDVPCGTGELARLLAQERPEFSVTGADLSLAMLRQAGRKLPDHAYGWVRSDVARLPFPDNHFDQVVCASGLHDFHAPDLAMRELHRVLRDDGTLVLLDWCADYLSMQLVG